jgi:hypothetical protein
MNRQKTLAKRGAQTPKILALPVAIMSRVVKALRVEIHGSDAIPANTGFIGIA